MAALLDTHARLSGECLETFLLVIWTITIKDSIVKVHFTQHLYQIRCWSSTLSATLFDIESLFLLPVDCVLFFSGSLSSHSANIILTAIFLPLYQAAGSHRDIIGIFSLLSLGVKMLRVLLMFIICSNWARKRNPINNENNNHGNN